MLALRCQSGRQHCLEGGQGGTDGDSGVPRCAGHSEGRAPPESRPSLVLLLSSCAARQSFLEQDFSTTATSESTTTSSLSRRWTEGRKRSGRDQARSRDCSKTSRSTTANGAKASTFLESPLRANHHRNHASLSVSTASLPSTRFLG